jgi:hypothetical protein
MVLVHKFLIFVLIKKVHCPLFVNTWFLHSVMSFGAQAGCFPPLLINFTRFGLWGVQHAHNSNK